MEYHKKIIAVANTFYDFSHYEELIDTTQYGIDKNGDILFYFIKDGLSKQSEEVKNILKDKAKILTQNRGSAAGVCDIKKFPKWATSLHNNKTEEKLTDKDNYVSVKYKSAKTGQISKRAYSNPARSSALGFFDKAGPLHCREVGWSLNNSEKQKKILPLVNEISQQYKDKCFDYWKKQKIQSDKSPSYILGNSVFSTLTINYDFRTACHKDTGDFKEGLSTLTVIEELPDNYVGFYTGLPEYKICFDIREGDLLLFNAHEYHCNTEGIAKSNKLGMDTLLVSQANESKSYCGRIGIVSYLRQNLYKCDELIKHKIVIPSFNRPDILKEKTLTLLRNNKIRNTDIYIFLNDNKQKKLYHLPNSYNIIIDGATNIMERRNNIINYFEEGERLVMIDDDLKEIIDFNKNPANIRKLITDMFIQLRDKNIGLGGIYPVSNPFFMRNKITFDLRYCIGCFSCLINDKCALRSVGTLEDFELTISYYKKYGGVCRFWNYAVDTSYYCENGGITNGDNETRNILTDIEADMMIEKYPDYIRTKTIHKKSGNTNLKLKILPNKNNISNILIKKII